MYFQFPFRSLFLFFVTKNHLWPEPQLASIKSPPIRKKHPGIHIAVIMKMGLFTFQTTMMAMMRKKMMKRMTKTRTRKTTTRRPSSTRTAKSTRSLRGPGEVPEGLQESTPLTQPPPSLGAEVTGTTSGLTTSKTTSISS